MKVRIFRELSRITNAGMDVIDADIEAQMSAFTQTVNVKSAHQTQTSVVSPHPDDGCLYVTTVFSVWYEELDKPEKSELQKLLDTPLEKVQLNLGNRCTWCFSCANLKTLRQICVKTERELLRYRRFGNASLARLKRELATVGLQVGMSEQELSAL